MDWGYWRRTRWNFRARTTGAVWDILVHFVTLILGNVSFVDRRNNQAFFRSDLNMGEKVAK